MLKNLCDEAEKRSKTLPKFVIGESCRLFTSKMSPIKGADENLPDSVTNTPQTSMNKEQGKTRPETEFNSLMIVLFFIN